MLPADRGIGKEGLLDDFRILRAERQLRQYSRGLARDGRPGASQKLEPATDQSSLVAQGSNSPQAMVLVPLSIPLSPKPGCCSESKNVQEGVRDFPKSIGIEQVVDRI